ncbi:MAG: DNA polymerase V [Aquificaceae bacterium]|nr:MAG: DNA polymerase V [Aquificaceae bacterium]
MSNQKPKKINKRGGKRPNSGRKPASAPFKEKTKPIRVPISLIPSIKETLEDLKKLRKSIDIENIVPIPLEQNQLRIPLFANTVPAGSPTPTDDYIDNYLSLNDLLIKREDSSFFIRVVGLSMVDANIYPDDILIVDRSMEAVHGKVVIAILDNELTVKRLDLSGDSPVLKSENPEYPNIPVNSELLIWGVVTSVIHQL